MTRRRFAQWVVMETDEHGGGCQLFQFDTNRNAEGVRVAFASGHSATFVLALIANGMEVVP